jgi:WD40 repeat protein
VVLSGHTGAVNSAVFAPDGGRILTASDDNTARLPLWHYTQCANCARGGVAMVSIPQRGGR